VGVSPRWDLESGEEEGVRSREQAQFVAPSSTGYLALFGLGRARSAVGEYKKEDGILNTRPLRRMTISWNAVLQFQNRLWRFLVFFYLPGPVSLFLSGLAPHSAISSARLRKGGSVGLAGEGRHPAVGFA